MLRSGFTVSSFSPSTSLSSEPVVVMGSMGSSEMSFLSSLSPVHRRSETFEQVLYLDISNSPPPCNVFKIFFFACWISARSFCSKELEDAELLHSNVSHAGIWKRVSRAVVFRALHVSDGYCLSGAIRTPLQDASQRSSVFDASVSNLEAHSALFECSSAFCTRAEIPKVNERLNIPSDTSKNGSVGTTFSSAPTSVPFTEVPSERPVQFLIRTSNPY